MAISAKYQIILAKYQIQVKTILVMPGFWEPLYLQPLPNPQISSAMAMAMSIYRTLCVLVITQTHGPTNCHFNLISPIIAKCPMEIAHRHSL